MKKITLLLLLLVSTTLIFAQENHKKCISTKLVEEELKNNTDYVDARNNSGKINYNYKERKTNNIPVVIHIIHRTSHANIGSGTNIPDIQIEDALRILNEDFSKTNPEFPNPPRNNFLNYWGNPELEFCLATTDPDGNATSGVTRTATAQTNWDADNNTESNAMKQNSSGGKDSWDPKKYLNIGSLEFSKLLLKNGAEINTENNGWTAIDFATDYLLNKRLSGGEIIESELFSLLASSGGRPGSAFNEVISYPDKNTRAYRHMKTVPGRDDIFGGKKKTRKNNKKSKKHNRKTKNKRKSRRKRTRLGRKK